MMTATVAIGYKLAMLAVGHSGHRPATLAVGMVIGQHAVCAGECIPVPTWTRLQSGDSIPMQKRNIVRRVGKSITEMVVQGYQMTAGSL